MPSMSSASFLAVFDFLDIVFLLGFNEEETNERIDRQSKKEKKNFFVV